jgi:hypothetical protein
MSTYIVKGRKTGALQTVTVEASSRDEAIAQVVGQVEEGEEFEIFDAQLASAAGATGATGAAGRR